LAFSSGSLGNGDVSASLFFMLKVITAPLRQNGINGLSRWIALSGTDKKSHLQLII